LNSARKITPKRTPKLPRQKTPNSARRGASRKSSIITINWSSESEDEQCEKNVADFFQLASFWSV
jgi:hypothetical protein